MIYKEIIIIIITIRDNSNNKIKIREEKEKIKFLSTKATCLLFFFFFFYSQAFENASNFLLVIAMQTFLMSVQKHLETTVASGYKY